MKKIIAIIMCLVIACGVFAACSKKEPDKNDPGAAENTSAVTTATITTDSAVIKEADAINLIKSYSAEELSLSDDDYKNCHYLVNKSGIKVENDYYISVIAAITSEKKGDDGKTYVNFDHKGEYFIRYDGKQILKKDMTSEEDKYSELKVKEVPTSAAAQEAAEDTTK